MIKRRRVAVIGAGFMGSMHAGIFANMVGSELAAIVDPNRVLAEAVAAKAPGCKIYDSHQALLSTERDLDLVSICTPDNLHLAPAAAVAEAGISIFVEKPISSKVEDAKAIIAACEAANVKLGVGYLLRFDPRYAAAKELMISGRIGEPIHIYARRNSARTEGPKRYGGKLPLALHVTVHDVDMVLWMLEGQHPVSIYAQQTDRLLGSSGTQDSIAAIVRFSGGTVVNFESAWSLPSGARHMIDARMEVIGTDGSFEVQCGDSGLYFASNEGSREIDTQHWPLLNGRIDGDLARQLGGLIDWLDGAAMPIATGQEALRSLELTLAMMQSAESGEIVRLG
ncbi:Gfo/Idh/MocA family protein [Mesorhizobium amorphae]|uniref:Oxidoreductase domain-containing protein n=1 Tax=Mesorhizobium amorphae CCNWGS0123 TaxID=1082933 RepID=G6YIN0_9HYPH|nr:Gfo/Idh/MocA family oxidoreductase [Mesorhizobium amorphae]ANT52990.1 oxidoreductase [Mesorhizobium amorphae CCNWGS0123]EHH05912.1 oxidoreductase domain-containing protein [Mesorhizobium amorphae CCNWGS0123]GLR40861.1 oxidoreductase [Mesorhizobium amorphae]